MSKLKTLKYLICNNRRGIVVAIFDNIVKTGILNGLSDEKYVSLMYKVHVGKKLNLDNPKGFNEKLQWLKLYDHNPAYIEMVDKIDAKKYVAHIIGEEFIIPTIQVWDSVEEIDFSSLPNKFVIKCSHDSGSVVVCKDKNQLNIKEVKKKLQHGMRRNLYYWGREWPYKSVKPRILAEKYLDDGNKELIDYKFMCFNGKVKCLFTVTNRFSGGNMHVTFYDIDWNIMPFARHYGVDSAPIDKPKSFDKMVELSEKLSTGLTFARIDFYEVEGKPYFGEITLCPGNGIEKFSPDVWDYKIGDMMVLPKEKVSE